MSEAAKINRQIEGLLAKVRIAPAGQREKLVARVRVLRAKRDVLILEEVAA